MEYIIFTLKIIGIFIYMTHGSEEAIMVLKQIMHVVKIVKVLLLPEASASYHLTNMSSFEGGKNPKRSKPKAKRRLEKEEKNKKKKK